MKTLRSTILAFAFPVSFISACASTPGADPHDMSAAHHEAMAANEDAEAKGHAEQHDPEAEVAVRRCSNHKGRLEDGACWTSITNPTAEHLAEAKKHQKMAADHRAASQALREAEAKACVGIADADRDMSPFDHREDIVRVEPLMAKAPVAKGQGATSTAGATITFRAIPDMTAPWLQRIVDCHIARNASLGHDVPEMSYCPLVPKGVTAEVTAVDGGLTISVRSDDPASANEVLSRARALVAH